MGEQLFCFLPTVCVQAHHTVQPQGFDMCGLCRQYLTINGVGLCDFACAMPLFCAFQALCYRVFGDVISGHQ